ncbi:glycosyltransferase [Synergistes jonesii]|uniref:UDP-4-amino-4-deoxy-L-arabinose-oxoglutarate aminotransferase n=1 Tax=Synergistes jonesii TaxID=2754 RepID=A0A073IQ85_9BACT|nr:glycosyltransferase [Synergistes jonesii]KEJ91641.1 UDP-4-amino-4-deoxy-L-arabinose-oxoglutarate aminotransferase [Synergistes jonesii]OFB60867.1 UDP-4-amino-4-deoxy-L-arabinose-oxoglutarate aminotransferase [Synergistes jonesii]OFB61826.1 UDP-4-amino-4-deoxy-L-arabinose-oxoglutarate aminotransferase [Synergistes jonesii]OFB62623.1 UDP-4-amino-4-deoxy-L-arabinose-oxoglutarate aminotransferase [Synergistes jonesii]OFB66909.1 UDP-4-amino-4-deoxy-L-arabinose-oxoglutarate aminotransferase [Syne
MTEEKKVEVSIVIPAYNEEESLHKLFDELWPVVENLGRSFEVIFINDGSRDATLSILRGFCEKRRGVRVIDLGANFGQHMAIMAGFDYARGEKIVTLDADLQNPPEEIPKLLKEMDEGHDVVGTYRVGRRDPIFRRAASKCVNKITNRIAKLHIQDYGCMLRGYDRRIIDIINESRETTTFIPALAQKFAVNPIEIPVAHRERELGESKYGLFQLIRLNFDLMTSFSLVPLQLVTMAGMLLSALSFLFLLYMFVRRLLLGVGTWQSFIEQAFEAAQFIVSGITLFALGIIGEYIGRIYREVSRRPRYAVRKVYEYEGNGE